MSKVSELVFVAFLSALLVISKEIIAFIPNIELVSFLLILFAKNFKLRVSLMIATVFCFIEIILYGIGDWTIMYFVMWNGLVLLVNALRYQIKTGEGWAFLSGIFGLTFGFFFSLPYLVFSVEAAVAYWMKGIFFDLVHAIGNYIVMMLLYDKTDMFLHQRFHDL